MSTSPILPPQSRVVVAGAGSAGLWAAFWLRKLGYAVEVLEAASDFEAYTQRCNATWAAAGMLAPANELEPTELPLLHAGVAASKLHAQLAAGGELGNVGYSAVGTLEVPLSPDEASRMQQRLAWQLAAGLRVEWLSRGELLAKEPGLHPGLSGGIFAPEDTQVDNRLLVQQLLAWLAAHQVPVHWGAELAQVAAGPAGKGLTLALANGATHGADALLLAPGAKPPDWAPAPERVYPLRGQMLRLQPNPQLADLQHVVRFRSRQLGDGYLVPKAGAIVVGSTAEEVGHHPGLTAGGVLDILRKACAAMPGLAELPILETYSGLRPATRGRVPFLAPHPSLPVWHLNGLFRNGILLGPLVGLGFAQHLRNGIPFSLSHLPNLVSG